MSIENPPAFPESLNVEGPFGGMSLRDWFAGQALSNAYICTGDASHWQITRWFGEGANGITRAQIAARQAAEFADAMLAERKKEPSL